MKKINIIALFTIFLLLLASCSYFEYDNFDAPASAIEGNVFDKETSDLILGEALNSYKVEYYELSWEEAGHTNTQPMFFWGKADGTYKNTKIFEGKYRITLKEGAFHQPDPVIVSLKNNKIERIDFNVIPFVRVEIVEYKLTGALQNNLEIKYRVVDTEKEVELSNVNENDIILSEARAFLSSKTPNVGVNNTDSKYTLNAKKNISNYTIGVPKTYTETSIRGLIAGKYWLRIGARTDNAQKRYNFTPVIEINVPKL